MRLLKEIIKQRGIGFLEMIVALGVIVTGVIGGLTLTTSNLVSSSASENRLLAANLTREAIEVIRNKRDSNWLAAADWFSGILQSANNYRLITSFNSVTNSWSFADQTVNLNQCSACQIYYHPLTGVFSHDAEGGELTTYKRLVTLRQICWQEEINEETILAEGQECSEYQNVTWVGWEIKAEVSWQEGTGSHLLNVIDRIYNWK